MPRTKNTTAYPRPHAIGLRLSPEELSVLTELELEQRSTASEILRRAFRATYPERFGQAARPQKRSRKST